MPRGSDFEARWKEGSWAELRILEALNREAGLIAVQFGITDGTAFWSLREMEARDLPNQNQHGKRPDILVFQKDNLSAKEMQAVEQLVFQSDEDAEDLTRRAIMAVESEFSPYAYKYRLEQYGKQLSFTIKEEDLAPLVSWQKYFKVPLGIVQCYLDSSYFLSFQTLQRGIKSGAIPRQWERNYGKWVYYPSMSQGIPFADFSQSPKITAEVILDKYGKYTAYRKVTGGSLKLQTEMQELFSSK